MAGKILKISKGGGSGTPGGSDKEVQFNDAGVFGGGSQLFWDKVNNRLGIGDSTPAKQLSLTKCMELLTTTSSAIGVIYKDANRFIHDYKAAGADGNNVFVGLDAGNFSMAISGQAYHASYNVGIGRDALKVLTEGYYNIGIGAYALSNAATANSNVGIGQNALQENVNGDKNIAIGRGTGYGINATSISNNVLLGHCAGYALTTGGDNNILIGYRAGDNVTSGERNIVIGYDLNALAAASNYQLNIGRLIFGDLGVTKKVGINTSTMNETLNVGGAVRLGTSALTNNGAIRWNGSDFEGYMTGWKSLTILKGLNEIFTTRGDILFRGIADPTRLASSAIGASLTSGGVGADPFWYKPMSVTGDLLVEDAAGYAVRLAAGAAGLILTANGVGAKPSWQAGGGTKEFFVPATAHIYGTMGTKGTYAAIILTSNDQYSFMTFRVPHDFSSITNATVVVIPSSTQGSAEWSIRSNYAQTGEHYQTHAQSDAGTTYNVHSNTIYEVDISGILTSLAANDMVGIELRQLHGVHDVNVLGVRFKYA